MSGLSYHPVDDSAEDVPPDFEDAIKRAFPDADWDAERLRAMKEAIHICWADDESKEDDGADADTDDDGGKSHSALALLFGKPKGK